MSQFQIILTSIFAFFILVGVIMFAGFGRDDSSQSIGTVIIWGTVDEKYIKTVINDLIDRDKAFEQVKYIQKDALDFNRLLAEAMAEGSGPDIFLLSQSEILKHQNKISPIPYKNFSLRDFKDYFIEEGELFLRADGILALPLMVDPLVMYWNRSIFTQAGVAKPPQYWDDFFPLAKKLTEKDAVLNILTSAVALGEFANITNAKEILATLIMQTGNSITYRDDEGMVITLRDSIVGQTTPTESALRFYTEFSNPVKETYSWNKSLPKSQIAFLSGDLAIYFGFAGEFDKLRVKNPNLNFDVAYLPQTGNLKNDVTFGKMQGLAISKGTKNIAGAFGVITNLIKNESMARLSALMGTPPVTRALLQAEPTDPYQHIFFKSALSARAFLDPDEENTNLIFQDMVESVVSGRRRLSEAVSRADTEMEALLK